MGPASAAADVAPAQVLVEQSQVDAVALRSRDECGRNPDPNTLDSVEFQGELWPSHVYVFSRWVTDGSTDAAYIVDNQGNEHIRNMTVPGSYDQFQYFMRSPKMPWDGLDLNAGWD